MSDSGLQAHAVRKNLTNFLNRFAEPGDKVLIGVSGGADSLALAAALGQVAPELSLQTIAVVIDHSMQEGSAEVAQKAKQQCMELGIKSCAVVTIQVKETGEGAEAAARAARHHVLQQIAQEQDAKGILLAHTMDDQAETVLIRLSRGSGSRSLAAMSAVTMMPNGQRPLWRPMLNMTRLDVRASLLHYNVEPHQDPQNHDPRFLRARVRHELMPVLEKVLGAGVQAALVRTAELSRMDADALDQTAAIVAQVVRDAEGLDVNGLRGESMAIQTRVVRAWLQDFGVPGAALGFGQVMAVARLIVDPNVAGPIALPGGVEVVRESGRLRASRRQDGREEQG